MGLLSLYSCKFQHKNLLNLFAQKCTLLNRQGDGQRVSKLRNGKAWGTPCVVLEIIKIAGEAGGDLITNLVNQIIVQGVIPEEWKLNTIVNCEIIREKEILWREQTIGDWN